MDIIEPTRFLELVWGKSDRENPSRWHTLLHHMLDSAAVCQVLWDKCLSESFKSDISNYFGSDSKTTGRLMAFWVGLHDIGKAGPEFQRKNTVLAEKIVDNGFVFPERGMNPKGFHGTATTIILRRIFKELEPNMPRKFRSGLSTALGGHHGIFPDDGEISDYDIERINTGDGRWQEIQNVLYMIAEDLLKPQEPVKYPVSIEAVNSALLLIVGLTTTADWISSNEDYFEFVYDSEDPRVYLTAAVQKAETALRDLGWTGWHARNAPLSFKQLFPDFEANSLQKAVIDQTEKIGSPFLAIIEAQTGSGKTEAALYMADTILQRENKAGIYIAMPTQATSNQMFSRVTQFLKNRYSQDDINLHLVHGKAMPIVGEKDFEPDNIYSDENIREGSIQSHIWFLPRKKTLLAPFGVGTVDQTFLSVLRTKHFFVRMFGLSHKVLIFDEVHAYDVYMTEIFKTLLHWLRATGTSVIILTATLPQKTKDELLQAYSGLQEKAIVKPFPRLSIATGKEIRVIQAGEQENRAVSLKWLGKRTQEVIWKAVELTVNGGCAAIICNTVARAQDMFLSATEVLKNEDCEIILFHSRFPYCWRKEIEEQVLRLFGKDRSFRPRRAILIATQVIEQSLDLDFDIMISDMAPIDLLIQRLGRLHRHKLADNCKRPEMLQKPTCFISAYDKVGETINHGGDIYVYEPYILGKTHAVLQWREEIALPAETDALIRAVYEEKEGDEEALQKAWIQMIKNSTKSQQNAHNYLIPMSNKQFLGSQANFFGDDSGSIASRTLNAPTREIETSVQIVCLEERADGLRLVNDEEIIDLNQAISKEKVRKCLEAEVSISNKAVMQALIAQNQQSVEAFKQIAALHWHVPMIFRNGRCELGQFQMILDRRTGISIGKNGEDWDENWHIEEKEDM